MKSIDLSGMAAGLRAAMSLMFPLFIQGTALAQVDALPGLGGSEGSAWRWHLQSGLNAVAERSPFWNLAQLNASAQAYDPNKQWLEFYVKPGLSLQHPLNGGTTLYGKLSAVASYTSGTDAFAGGNQGAVTLEEGYLGLRGAMSDGQGVELSLGRRELKLGTGMLIANGGSSGFERGALKFGPRKAWDENAMAIVIAGTFRGTAFFLSPNELPASDGKNRLMGVDLRMDDPQGAYLGGTLLRVVRSDSPYPQAAPGGVGAPSVLPGARDGTRALNVYASTGSLRGRLAHWQFSADLAYEWNERVNLRAWGGRVQAQYRLAKLPWSPVLSYAYQSFSGDDPNTSRLERFDPLYFEGNPNAWSTGSKSSMAFVNSNVNAHLFALKLQPTAQDVLTLRYAVIRANQLRSPIQFGQATRFDTSGSSANVVAGVTSPQLARDLFLEYNRFASRNTFVSAGIAMSLPGKGIRDVVGGFTPNWSGAYVNVLVDY